MNKRRSWRSVLVGAEATILETIQVIDQGAMRVALVVDEQGHLLGVVTDGNIRRGLLNQIGLQEPVSRVMNPHPITVQVTDSREQVLALMNAREIEHLPVVDERGVLVGMELLQELTQPLCKENWVVLMAGGLGSRLGAITRDCPKPLLRVGHKPILEVILESFLQYGFRRFYLSVNYKKQMIQEYFGNGAAWGAEIRYLEEKERMGTAGSLSLLPEPPEQPFFVMNGDLLTRIHFQHILDFHATHQAQATLCVRRVEQTIPFGVVELAQHRLLAIEEKPTHHYFVNAGIYVLDPAVLSLIPAHHYLDMPDLLRKVVAAGMTAAAFPFLDYWMDIGQMGDYDRARQEYEQIFQ
ncbi:nucleotidyltransferase family protein [Candidatus Magnetaquicoccus inordinatus]|uniref:nucleotidyltransferase family protein n=1 Tax=Candidatus Magnetaquicoccus inordinatus TaxID=2496818 RepID=UPI00102BF97B|nr:nucleotidyltransferase family protein [Candidatus Magnetaquicoccus inordinatus]